jgi:chemotaxis protein MotB
MSELLKKPRLPRINRTQKLSLVGSIMSMHGGDSNDHLWVVSYADLLMVLLCFFVLFFSVGKEGRNTLIHRILMNDLKGVSKTVASGSEGGMSTQANSGGHTPYSSRDIESVLKGLNLTTLKEGESLVLFFPDDVYPKGKTELPDSEIVVLNDLLTRLKPYQHDMDLVFVGHTDPSPVAHAKTSKIEDNFDLSSARAKRALRIAEKMNFPTNHLRIEADGSFKRSSRTLSITVQESRRDKGDVK